MASSRAGTRSVVSIPKILHAIWVGDESRRPDRWIQTWRMMHPTWAFKVWGNADYEARAWKSKRQMEIFRALKHWEGVADLMRYEILHEQGGVYVDADSACVRPLDDWLLDTRMFAIWESERHRPGLVANGFIGSIPGHPALEAIIRVTARMHKTPVSRRSWRSIRFEGVRPRFEWTYDAPSKTVGPYFFTKMIRPFCPDDVTILPSVMFLPKHFLDAEERHSSLIYARHEWGTSHQLLALESPYDLEATAARGHGTEPRGRGGLPIVAEN